MRRRSSPGTSAAAPRGIRPAPLLGAHVSIAGGFVRAVERGRASGCRTIQVFVKGSVNWRARCLDEEEATAFRAAVARAGLGPVLAHGSYLTNLAEGEPAARRRAIDAFREELERARRLGIDAVVLHPGAHRGAGAEAGIERVREALHELLAATQDSPVSILLENTAGMGSSLGASLEELRALLRGLRPRRRLGVCIDTCHAFAAGYDLRDAPGWERFWGNLGDGIGIERVRALHVNDSKGGLGCRLDRHEHIGRGQLGPEPFRRLMRDERLHAIPKLIETPKEGDMDRRNLGVLRRAARP